MKIAIIGYGLIGEKRSKALGNNELVIVADKDNDRTRRISEINPSTKVTAAWQEAVEHPTVDIVIVSTTNDWLAPISLHALNHGKHVIVEKPAARTPEELEPLVNKILSSEYKVKVGFNLRYHPAIKKAKEISDSGVLGNLMFIRGRYGHGGRIGYEQEWRADSKISGGGELMDQGIHLIDLSRWFLGEFKTVKGTVETYYWDMPVEDNAFLALRTEKGQTAWLHASCSEWKNLFCLEIYGQYGKLQIDGLGGSYGIERLTYYKMLPEMGPPETTIWEYPGADTSWESEFGAFVNSIKDRAPLCGDLNDAYQALQIIKKIYGGKYE
ncbi:Gfo/Idh/MocA family oxidoreductase [Desulfococcaceae bacterium HSG9]|nr:Gfo/Idh/MocA family oxidoreductase [Desulfococcaceae bacterium HSG9]